MVEVREELDHPQSTTKAISISMDNVIRDIRKKFKQKFGFAPTYIQTTEILALEIKRKEIKFV